MAACAFGVNVVSFPTKKLSVFHGRRICTLSHLKGTCNQRASHSRPTFFTWKQETRFFARDFCGALARLDVENGTPAVEPRRLTPEAGGRILANSDLDTLSEKIARSISEANGPRALADGLEAPRRRRGRPKLQKSSAPRSQSETDDADASDIFSAELLKPERPQQRRDRPRSKSNNPLSPSPRSRDGNRDRDRRRKGTTNEDISGDSAFDESSSSQGPSFVPPSVKVVSGAVDNLIQQREHRKAEPTKRFKKGDFVVFKKYGVGLLLGKGTYSDTRTGKLTESVRVKFADSTIDIPYIEAKETMRLFRKAESEGAVKLSTVEDQKKWRRTLDKAKKGVEDVALNLMKLYQVRLQHTRPRYPVDSPRQVEFEAAFPFAPSPDQLGAFEDVRRDMVERDQPMDRLICGDVGFGKTEVALRAMFRAVASGKQVAFLAPTTILASQQFQTAQSRCTAFGVKVALLTRFQSTQEQHRILEELASGELHVVVGTHSILSAKVSFRELGLLIIDEEQRFGVEQKERIKRIFTDVDVLTLSATPIPRTLNMALTGFRDISLIMTPPLMRQAIHTHAGPYNEALLHKAVANELQRGGQVYYVLPRIEGMLEAAASLQKLFPKAKIAHAHGRMADLEHIMIRFAKREYDVLVCTTIIESGLDISSVNTIVIQDADYFGLSQLYQLRGRVGRSDLPAYAFLFHSPDKTILKEEAEKRLQAVIDYTELGSGYHLATRDMEIRGVGTVFGVKQSGMLLDVGIELFQDLLIEHMQRISDRAFDVVQSTAVSLAGLTARLPKYFEPDEGKREELEQRLQSVTDVAELERIGEDLTRERGPLPSPVQDFLVLAEAKAYARGLGIQRIEAEGMVVSLHTTWHITMYQYLVEENLNEALRIRFDWSFSTQPQPSTPTHDITTTSSSPSLSSPPDPSAPGPGGIVVHIRGRGSKVPDPIVQLKALIMIFKDFRLSLDSSPVKYARVVEDDTSPSKHTSQG